MSSSQTKPTKAPVAATRPPLGPPPRRVRVRWGFLLGPGARYLAHVATFLLLPTIFLGWLLFMLTWAAVGTLVEGRAHYRLIAFRPAEPPRTEERITYQLGGEALEQDVTLSMSEWHRLGMPDLMRPGPDGIAFEAPAQVRALRLPRGYVFARPVFPWSRRWSVLLAPALLLLASSALLAWFHGEAFALLWRTYHLVRHGQLAAGSALGTHETGWREDYRTYIRRCYLDYTFRDPHGREHRGSHIALGALDPASLPEGHPITILYDPADPTQSLAYELSILKARPA